MVIFPARLSNRERGEYGARAPHSGKNTVITVPLCFALIVFLILLFCSVFVHCFFFLFVGSDALPSSRAYAAHERKDDIHESEGWGLLVSSSFPPSFFIVFASCLCLIPRSPSGFPSLLWLVFGCVIRTRYADSKFSFLRSLATICVWFVCFTVCDHIVCIALR